MPQAVRRDQIDHRLGSYVWPVLQRYEILHEHAVYEDVPASDFSQKQALGGVIEEADIVRRRKTLIPEESTNNKVLKKKQSALSHPT